MPEVAAVVPIPLLATSPLRPAEGALRLERDNRPYTLAEVDAAIDEGSEWWEADKGVLIINAPPSVVHQRWVMGLAVAWRFSIDRAHWQVLTGPQRVVLDPTTWAEPDVAIWPAGDVDPAAGEPSPHLVAEVLSPSTARRDRRDKPALYGRAGVTWLVLAEPSADAPAIEIYQLDQSGDSRRTASAVGGETLWCPLTGANLTPAVIAQG